MSNGHEVGRACYEAFCNATDVGVKASSWMRLAPHIKEIWQKVEIAGFQASAKALACSVEQHKADEQRIHDLEQGLIGSITG